MPAVRIRRRKSVALASAAVLAGLAVPALTPATAGASAPAHEAPAAQARVAAVATYADYYEGAEGKTGEALKSALHSIISDQTKLSYSAVWNALKETDEDPSNSGNVILLYSGASRSKSLNGGDVGDWNREHVWAKSHGDFGTSTGPGTDIHHLRPSDVQVNSIRGNKDFDNGGSTVTNGGGSLTDSDSFEPRDAVKGDVARMILYMAVRYEGTDGWPDLEPNDSVSNGSAPYIGKLSVLKEWHEQDPPDSFEQRRNDVIFESYQHNRNPFIDHPEWVEAIW
ncbi:ribonuclease [Streptomyces coelicolor]|nr:ribonuclease [Streptomyces coelicolor]